MTGACAAKGAAVRRGHLVLVVGPSGAGKDSILDGVRTALANDRRFVFVRREITRPADAGGEDHQPITWEEFRNRAVNGSYALAWEAHGCGYGVPASGLNALADGCSAIVNVSRGVVASAQTRFAPIRIIQITVPERILAERLARRGRESAEDIAQRLARSAVFQVEGSDVLTLVNDGPLSRSVESFIAALWALPASG